MSKEKDIVDQLPRLACPALHIDELVKCTCGDLVHPEDLQVCHHPGCTTIGCDACEAIRWYHAEGDEDCGDYFCEKHGAM